MWSRQSKLIFYRKYVNPIITYAAETNTQTTIKKGIMRTVQIIYFSYSHTGNRQDYNGKSGYQRETENTESRKMGQKTPEVRERSYGVVTD